MLNQIKSEEKMVDFPLKLSVMYLTDSSVMNFIYSLVSGIRLEKVNILPKPFF